MKTWLVMLLLLGCVTRPSVAQNISNLLSFSEETKIKGPFVPVRGDLCFVSEKGGNFGWGYIGKYSPRSATISVLASFSVETKAKGLCRMGNELWFVCEKGGRNNLGYVGRYVLTNGNLEQLHDFSAPTAAKSAPFVLDGSFCFFAEAGGTYGQGALMSYSVESGLVTLVSFNTTTGIKPEAPPVWHGGHWYYGSREGGDITQRGGKGAGTLGVLDLQAGVAVKLIDLNVTNHGARIKCLCPLGSRIYYTTDEGGNLTLNAGKGGGAVGYFDPSANSITQLFVCAHTNMGIKPKGLVSIEDCIYFNCGEGGPQGCGMWYSIAYDDTVTCMATNDVWFGSKGDMITQFGPRIYCATEQGGQNWLGGIGCLEFECDDPILGARVEAGAIQLEWPVLANDAWLEWAATLDGPWIEAAEPGVHKAVWSDTGAQGFLRILRR